MTMNVQAMPQHIYDSAVVELQRLRAESGEGAGEIVLISSTLEGATDGNKYFGSLVSATDPQLSRILAAFDVQEDMGFFIIMALLAQTHNVKTLMATDETEYHISFNIFDNDEDRINFDKEAIELIEAMGNSDHWNAHHQVMSFILDGGLEPTDDDTDTADEKE